MSRWWGAPATATRNLHCKVENLFPFSQMFSHKKRQTFIVYDYFVVWAWKFVGFLPISGGRQLDYYEQMTPVFFPNIDLLWEMLLIFWEMPLVFWEMPLIFWEMSLVFWEMSLVFWEMSLVFWEMSLVFWEMSLVFGKMSVIFWGMSVIFWGMSVVSFVSCAELCIKAKWICDT